MTWIINDDVTLEFSVRTARLSNRKYHDLYVDIPFIAGELIKILLIARGEVITYNWLIYLLWEKRKLRGSYNNLTLNVLRARDALEVVGLDRTAIVNLPGKGYCCTLTGMEKTSFHEIQEPIKVNAGYKRKLLVFTIFIALICALDIYNLPSHRYRINGAFYLFKDRSCNIYTFDRIPRELKGKLISEYKKNVPEELRGCSSAEIGMVYIQDAFDSKPLHGFFYARCQVQESKILSCQSYIKSVGK